MNRQRKIYKTQFKYLHKLSGKVYLCWFWAIAKSINPRKDITDQHFII